MWEMLLPLILVAGLSGLIVSVFYAWINPIIEARREQEVIEMGLRTIFPEAARMSAVEIDDLPPGVEAPVYEVFDNQNQSLGLMYYVTGQGWDIFRLAVGVDPVEKRLSASGFWNVKSSGVRLGHHGRVVFGSICREGSGRSL